MSTEMGGRETKSTFEYGNPLNIMANLHIHDIHTLSSTVTNYRDTDKLKNAMIFEQ